MWRAHRLTCNRPPTNKPPSIPAPCAPDPLSLPFLPADGRDVPDGSSVQFTQSLKDDLAAMEAAHPGLDAKIASGGGRMHVTMDRYEVCVQDGEGSCGAVLWPEICGGP